jgi:hypothetical protein
MEAEIGRGQAGQGHALQRDGVCVSSVITTFAPDWTIWLLIAAKLPKAAVEKSIVSWPAPPITGRGLIDQSHHATRGAVVVRDALRVIFAEAVRAC